MLDLSHILQEDFRFFIREKQDLSVYGHLLSQENTRAILLMYLQIRVYVYDPGITVVNLFMSICELCELFA